jgi:hypothetical protein
MKTLLLIAASMGIAAGAFAQGQVQIINDANHLLKYSSNPAFLKPADAAKAGTAVASPSSPNNTWMLELWGNPATGVGEGALTLLQIAGVPITGPVGGPVAGRFSGVNKTLPTGFPGGAASAPAPNSFQIRLWEKTAANYTSYAAALASGLAYTAKTPVFTMNPGPSAPNNMVAAASPSFSTWAAGEIVAIVPEPASASLIGLGLASLLIFRRRK